MKRTIPQVSNHSVVSFASDSSVDNEQQPSVHKKPRAETPPNDAASTSVSNVVSPGQRDERRQVLTISQGDEREQGLLSVSTTNDRYTVAHDLPKSSSHSSGSIVSSPTSGTALPRLYMPAGFTPSDQDVLCGRGGICKNWPGNVAYRAKVHSMLVQYSAAENVKQAKGAILDQVVQEIRVYGRFVKREESSGLWYDVGDFWAREKTSQLFRDALHERYTSSAHAKYRRRKRMQQYQKQKETSSGSSLSSSSCSNSPRKQTQQILDEATLLQQRQQHRGPHTADLTGGTTSSALAVSKNEVCLFMIDV